MKIVLLKMWNGFPVGRELDLGAGPAGELIRREYAEEVRPSGDAGATNNGAGATNSSPSSFTKKPAQSGTKGNNRPKLLANMT